MKEKKYQVWRKAKKKVHVHKTRRRNLGLNKSLRRKKRKSEKIREKLKLEKSREKKFQGWKDRLGLRKEKLCTEIVAGCGVTRLFWTDFNKNTLHYQVLQCSSDGNIEQFFVSIFINIYFLSRGRGVENVFKM